MKPWTTSSSELQDIWNLYYRPISFGPGEIEAVTVGGQTIFFRPSRWIPPGVLYALPGGKSFDPIHVAPATLANIRQLDPTRRGAPTDQEGWE